MTSVDKIRNIALIGHGGSGKTTLAESMLFLSKAISKRGTVEKGNTVTSTEPEEISRVTTIAPHFVHFVWKDVAINLIDTPGQFNFLAGTRAILPGIDGAIFLVSGVHGVKPEGERLWARLQEAEVPVIGFVNELDDEQANFQNALTDIQENLDTAPQALAIPIREENSLAGIVDLIKKTGSTAKDGKSLAVEIPAALQDEIDSFRIQLVEKVAESDDVLIEKYLEGTELTDDEVITGLKQSTTNKDFMPLFCGSALHVVGVEALLDGIVAYLPNPVEREEKRPFNGIDPSSDEEATRSASGDDPFSAFVLKTTIDPFSGKISIVRVVSGSCTEGSTIVNANHRSKLKQGHLYKIQGKELEKVASLGAGDIGAFSKLEGTRTGETVCDAAKAICFEPVKFADPSMAYAVEAEEKAQEKVSSGLNKLAEEDPTIRFYRDPETEEMLLAGMGQSHLEVTLERLARKFGGTAKLKTPRVPYRETIKKSVKVQGKLKKQTGGHGQFANCWLEVEPLSGEGIFQFEDKIVGGIIPKQFIPSVEKGVVLAMEKGILGGFPVVGVKVSLYDGSFHQVDSSDYAFQTAGSMAFKAAMEQAKAVLLEPIMEMEIIVPEETTGDVVKDLSGRRGRVLGMNAKRGKQVISAEVPMQEILEYAGVLNSITAGRGIFEMSVSTYREMPSQIADKILAPVEGAAEASSGSK